MKAVQLEDIGKLTFVEKEKPHPKDDEVILNIKACGICGSDIPRTYVTGSYHFPTVLGHEFSGEIIEVGKNLDSSLIGKKAAVFPLIPCNKCTFCKSSYFAQCENYNYFGSRTDGGFEEYLAVPEWNLVLLEDHITFEEGAMVEPATVAQHVINKAKVKVGDLVVIYGAGPIGLMVAQWAEITGASKVVLVDIDTSKVEFAKKIGFKNVINSNEIDPIKKLQNLYGKHFANIAIEATGSSEAFNQCAQSIGTFGKVVLLGNPHSDMVLNKETYDQFMRKEGKVIGIFNSVYDHYPKNEWKITAQAIADGKLNLKQLITHKVSLESLNSAFEMIYKKKEFYCKVMMKND